MSTETSRTPQNHASEQQVYSFILLIDGVDDCNEAVADALFDAGCDDAIFGINHGQAFLEFDRYADSAMKAIVSAIEAVEGCGCEIRVRQVVPPGEEAIGLVNAYLNLRSKDKEPAVRDLVNLLGSMPK